MEITTILMWIFTILIIIGLYFAYNTIKNKKQYTHEMEGPILIAIGLVGGIITGLFSGNKTTESFKTLYGIN